MPSDKLNYYNISISASLSERAFEQLTCYLAGSSRAESPGSNLNVEMGTITAVVIYERSLIHSPPS